MGPTVTPGKTSAAPRKGSRWADAWEELVAAMPIAILWRALREVVRQRAHRRAVLDALRR